MQSGDKTVVIGDRNCRLCASGVSDDRERGLAELIAIPSEEGDTMVLLSRGEGHVEVVPAAHVSRLSALPRGELAHVLATLRRAVLLQRPESGAVRLEPVDLQGSRGHVCIRVGPAPGSGRHMGTATS